MTDGAKVSVAFLDQKDLLVAAYDFDGQEQWRSRPGVFQSVHGFCSCPVVFKDLLIVNGDHGLMKVIKPGPTLEVVAENELSEDTFASPAICQGRVLIRGTDSLYCIE